VTIARVDGAQALPARFTLLMAFNPCPCGWLGARRRRCRCDDGQARRYAGRLSGPMRDRLDLQVRAEPPSAGSWDGAERSAQVAARVAAAWAAQHARQGRLNGELLGPGAAPGLTETCSKLLWNEAVATAAAHDPGTQLRGRLPHSGDLNSHGSAASRTSSGVSDVRP